MSFHVLHNLQFLTPLFPEVIVPHLDDKDNHSTGSCNEIGDEYEDTRTAKHQPLTHKTEAADRHHDEAWQGNTVSISCPDGLYGLRQITENQSEAPQPTKDLK
jgi:hypothetical protein